MNVVLYVCIYVCAFTKFLKDSGRRIEETKLKVVYITPAHQPSPIREEADGDGDVSPPDSVADNGSYNLTDLKSVSI